MNTKVLHFARAELDKYLGKLGVDADISLKLFSELGIDMQLADPAQDDAIVISVKDKRGFIAGSNERSVLIGVYRLLEEWGITWIRPGKDGTRYPDTCDAPDVEIREAAYLRHRIMCIEGACSKENILDMIEWLPKMGYNGYFIQFTSGYEFYERWYTHKLSTAKQPEVFTKEMAEAYTDDVIKEIKKRGLILQRFGHGWTCRAFGLPDNGWHKFEYEDIPKSFHDICAELGGERKCYHNVPLETQLCYSNPVVIDAMVKEFIKTAEKYPDCDVFHFWLGDEFNNTCECENCRKGNYTDHYVRMVNEITDRFEALGIDKKIVIIAYLNSAYPPETVTLKHPEKVIIMFAPITRTFSESFPESFPVRVVPEYKTNAFSQPAGTDENLAYLYGWKQVFDGDAVDFDYHLMWDHMLDAGGERIAKVLHTDISHFENLGMNGFISCQLQRNAFPTSIAMTAMAKTMWNRSADFDRIRRKLYAATFGEEYADELCGYFARLSEIFDIGVIRRQKPYDRETVKANMREAIRMMTDMEKAALEQKNCENDCIRTSWELLRLHGHMYSLIAQAIIAKLDGDMTLFEKLRDESTDFAFAHEDTLQPVLDCHFYRRMMVERINLTASEKRLG